MKISLAMILVILAACGEEEVAFNGQTPHQTNNSVDMGGSKTVGSNNNQGSNNGSTTTGTSASTQSGTTNNMTGGQSNGTTAAPICGDGVIEGEEVCEGDNFDGQVCEKGRLLCRADCLSIDRSECVPPDGEITSCRLLIQCFAPCTNTACFRACADRTTEPARSNAVNLGSCIADNSCRRNGMIEEACVLEKCAAESNACDMN